ncbi:DUF1835 domain-containing protein [Pontibacter ruber]|uniref:DUF1835 domain-containing protein n=1 Tax=Pontibacter ruber TaxID=1343895 RepID=A0ABW5D2Q8_9BACT|nr:DUF1835 domain-containing protein [Pontibacter ruber]
MEQLHILNGDASLPAFKAAGIAGQVLVWREILVDGPVSYALPEAGFWQQRLQHITSTFRETPEGYRQKVLEELQKLEQTPKTTEIVLWFDADLTCQVNQLYLLSKLQQLEFKKIFMCHVEASESIGLLRPDKLTQVYQKRLQLHPEQLQQAQELWKLYAGADPLLLQQYLTEKTILLPFLKNALHLHLQRFPDCRTGLGYPQQLLLQLIQDGAATEMELMQAFWHQKPGYGFGDWQLQVILSQLQPQLVTKGEPLQLTEYGREVLQQTKKAELSLPAEQWLGGVNLNGTGMFCYNRQAGKLQATHG